MSSTANPPEIDTLGQLPELLFKIQGNWPVLPSGIWNSSGIRTVLRYLQELSRKSEQAGLVNIHELTRSIDESINDVHEENAQPDAEEIEKLNNLLSELIEAVDASQSPKSALPDEVTSYDVIYLHRADVGDDQIIAAIEKNGWQVQCLTDSEALRVALYNQKAKVVLIDTEFLPNMSMVIQALEELRIQKIKRPELIFLSDQCDIEVRLEVIRTGAIQCLSKPININDLMLSIKQIIAPKVRPRYRVLIVEDDESQAIFASNLLRKGEFETLAITDPLNVMDAVQGFQPDLILMDLYMPGANGIELTQVIRERKESLTIPIVFLSGEDDLEKKLLALYSGADDFLTKPVRPQHLLATVKTRINRSKVMLSAGSDGLVDASTGLHNRRRLLQQLDLNCSNNQRKAAICGLFSICLNDQASDLDDWHHKGESNLIKRVADVAESLIGKRDFIARTGKQSLAILIQRPSGKAIEQFGAELYEHISDQLTLGSTEFGKIRQGIGLVLINAASTGAYDHLSHAETSAMQASQQAIKGYIRYREQTVTAPDIEKEAVIFHRKQFLDTLHSGLVIFREQRFSSSREKGLEIIEQTPLFKPSSDIELVANDIHLTAEQHGVAKEFDQFVCKHAIHKLGEYALRGIPTRLIIRFSAVAAKDTSLLEFIQSELRRLQVVGTGLMIEFNLPSLASDLKQARHFLGELSALGISVLLGNFACNDTAYKVLAYLKADAVRPHPSLLQTDAGNIHKIATQVHSLQAQIILPIVEQFGQISLHWSEAADYIQADYID
ncbi:MAG: response regulator [Candidatus Thiodiazotropha sp. (ex Epidulcina cf. delphinae)]|nr:response regulator [Candidatus Thiodiazotropha sp. (ex Epidulcina cf. delphinae)]